MQRLITIGIVIALAVYGFRHYRSSVEAAERDREVEAVGLVADSRPVSDPASANRFRCDGRTHCSQMTSCDEAFYFLRNCPGVKMDGEGDGVPCERQWCGNR